MRSNRHFSLTSHIKGLGETSGSRVIKLEGFLFLRIRINHKGTGSIRTGGHHIQRRLNLGSPLLFNRLLNHRFGRNDLDDHLPTDAENAAPLVGSGVQNNRIFPKVGLDRINGFRERECTVGFQLQGCALLASDSDDPRRTTFVHARHA